MQEFRASGFRVEGSGLTVQGLGFRGFIGFGGRRNGVLTKGTGCVQIQAWSCHVPVTCQWPAQDVQTKLRKIAE